jgi:hypothetical protein
MRHAMGSEVPPRRFFAVNPVVGIVQCGFDPFGIAGANRRLNVADSSTGSVQPPPV